LVAAGRLAKNAGGKNEGMFHDVDENKSGYLELD